MTRLLEIFGFQRKKSKLNQDACFELNGRFSTSSETVKDQNIILAAYIPAFVQCYISESCLRSIVNQVQSSSYEYPSYTQVRLFFEVGEIKRKRSGKPYSFSMLFTVVPQSLPYGCGAIVAGKHTNWPGSSEYTDPFRNASQKGHIAQRDSWNRESICTWLSKTDHSDKTRQICIKPAKINLKTRSDLQAEIGPEEKLSAQSTPVSTFQSHFDTVQTSQYSTTQHAASTPRIIVNESFRPSQPHQYSHDPSYIYSDPPRSSTIPVTPFEHSHTYSHDTTTDPTTTTSVSNKRDSAITNSSYHQQPTHESSTLNSALTSATSLQIDIRTEPRRDSYRAIQQQANFSPIEEVSLHHRHSTEEHDNLNYSSPQQPGISSVSLTPTSEESSVSTPRQNTTSSPLPSPANSDLLAASAKHISSKIGDIQIAEPAATTAEELAFLRANDPHWSWDEDTERYFRMHAKTGKVIWFGEGT